MAAGKHRLHLLSPGDLASVLPCGSIIVQTVEPTNLNPYMTGERFAMKLDQILRVIKIKCILYKYFIKELYKGGPSHL